MTTQNIKTNWPGTLVTVFGYLKPYKYYVLAAMAALLFTASISLSLGQGVRLLIDDGFVADSPDLLDRSVFIFMGLTLLLAIGSFTRFYLVSWIGERVVADIRKQVFAHLMHLHPGFFAENHSGEIQSRITTDTTLLQTVIGSSVSLALRNIIMMIGGFIWLLFTNVKLTAIVMGAVPVVVIPIVLFGRKVKDLSRISQDRVADVGAFVSERVQHIKTVQAYTHQPQDISAFDSSVDEAFSVAILRIRQRAWLVSSVIVLVLGAVGVMFWVGGRDVMSGAISPGELAAFVFYAVIVGASVGALSEVFGEIQRAAGAAERLVELLQTESLIQSPALVESLPEQVEGHIALDRVSFHYPTRPGDWALQDVSLDVAPHKVIALVGPSGAGKSTLFDLLLRFYDTLKGEIRVEGIPIQHMEPDALRKLFAIVPQQPALFSGSVASNIRYGDENASAEQVKEAATLAFADEFIQRLPNGYETNLGEHGIGLSGGQQQRLAIARAILKNPRFLLLDEATSALDAESEHKIQQALSTLMKNRTTFVIAHRLATVVHADQIVVMDKGRIVATGTHEQLLHESELYERFAKLQLLSDQA